MTEGGVWVVDQRPFSAHKSSVEDIQWSPNEDEVVLDTFIGRKIKDLKKLMNLRLGIRFMFFG